MKTIQKLILPLLFVLLIIIVYSVYFSPQKGLGSFSDFDTNNTANKEIIVKLIKDKPISKDENNGISTFYVLDKNGVEQPVQGPLMLPNNFNDAETIKLRGHLHTDHFHATEVTVN